MITGLPTFATRFGGPLEIIRDKVNGFYINPTQLAGMAETMLDLSAPASTSPTTGTPFLSGRSSESIVITPGKSIPPAYCHWRGFMVSGTILPKLIEKI